MAIGHRARDSRRQGRQILGERNVTERALSDYLAYLVAQTHRKLHGDLEKNLQSEGVSVEQWRVLEVLGDRKGLSMGEIADLALMNHPALTKMTDRMVARGLVHRLPDPQDQRRVLVTMTDRGLDLVNRVRSHVEDQNSAIEEHLGEKGSATLRKLLGSVIDLGEGR
jgi:DNA-binding MarR family transcriptional regulator